MYPQRNNWRAMGAIRGMRRSVPYMRKAGRGSAARTTRQLPRLTRPMGSVPLKFFETTESATGVSNVVLFTDLTATIGEGVTRSTRVGDTVCIKFIDYNFQVLGPSTVAIVNFRNTFAISNGVFLASGNMPQNVFTALAEPTEYKALRDDFVTLALNPVTVITGTPDTAWIRGRILINKIVTFVTGTSNASKNQIVWSCVSDQAGAPPTISGQVTISWCDV